MARCKHFLQTFFRSNIDTNLIKILALAIAIENITTVVQNMDK
jgi:hypothetical protein